jgi:hypothetical protein
MEGHPAVARAEPLLTAAAATARAERRTAPIAGLLVIQAELLLLDVERSLFVIAHARLVGTARVENVPMEVSSPMKSK